MSLFGVNVANPSSAYTLQEHTATHNPILTALLRAVIRILCSYHQLRWQCHIHIISNLVIELEARMVSMIKEKVSVLATQLDLKNYLVLILYVMFDITMKTYGMAYI